MRLLSFSLPLVYISSNPKWNTHFQASSVKVKETNDTEEAAMILVSPETSHLDRIIYSRGWRKLVQLYYLHEGTGLQLIPSHGSSTVLTPSAGVACSQFQMLRLLWLNKMLKHSLDRSLECKGMTLQWVAHLPCYRGITLLPLSASVNLLLF